MNWLYFEDAVAIRTPNLFWISYPNRSGTYRVGCFFSDFVVSLKLFKQLVN